MSSKAIAKLNGEYDADGYYIRPAGSFWRQCRSKAQLVCSFCGGPIWKGDNYLHSYIGGKPTANVEHYMICLNTKLFKTKEMIEEEDVRRNG